MFDELLSIAITKHPWVLIGSVLVGLLLRAFKNDSRKRKRLYPWISLGLGILCGVGAHLLFKETAAASVVGGLFVGVLPVSGHQLVVESLRNGKEIPFWLRLATGINAKPEAGNQEEPPPKNRDTE
jgi:hypothetical protein